MRILSTEIIINAGMEEVWKVLVDFEAYPQGNPFITKISGELKTGSPLNVTMKIEGRKPTALKPIIKSVSHGEKFCWQGNTRGSHTWGN